MASAVGPLDRLVIAGTVSPLPSDATFDLDKGQFTYSLILDLDKVNRMMEFQNARWL